MVDIKIFDGLKEYEDLKGLDIIKTATEMHNLIQTKLKLEDQKKSHIMKRYRGWTRNQSSISTVIKFFAVFDEPDDMAKNDGWGSCHIYKCVAVPIGKKEFEIFKKEVEVIPH